MKAPTPSESQNPLGGAAGAKKNAFEPRHGVARRRWGVRAEIFQPSLADALASLAALRRIMTVLSPDRLRRLSAWVPQAVGR
jgi:hypothetical protein